MARVLILLLLNKNGYEVGRYISLGRYLMIVHMNIIILDDCKSPI